MHHQLECWIVVEVCLGWLNLFSDVPKVKISPWTNEAVHKVFKMTKKMKIAPIEDLGYQMIFLTFGTSINMLNRPKVC